MLQHRNSFDNKFLKILASWRQAKIFQLKFVCISTQCCFWILTVRSFFQTGSCDYTLGWPNFLSFRFKIHMFYCKYNRLKWPPFTNIDGTKYASRVSKVNCRYKKNCDLQSRHIWGNSCCSLTSCLTPFQDTVGLLGMPDQADVILLLRHLFVHLVLA